MWRGLDDGLDFFDGAGKGESLEVNGRRAKLDKD